MENGHRASDTRARLLRRAILNVFGRRLLNVFGRRLDELGLGRLNDKSVKIYIRDVLGVARASAVARAKRTAIRTEFMTLLKEEEEAGGVQE